MGDLTPAVGAFFLTMAAGLFIWSIHEHPMYGRQVDRWWRAPSSCLSLAFAVACLVFGGAHQ